jgi:site-specific recombinase XerD
LPNNTVTLEDASNKFLAEKLEAVCAQALKKRSCDQQRHVVNALMRESGMTYVKEMRNPAFEKWLKSRELSPKGLHSYSKAIGVFVNWCIAKKYLVESPLADIAIPEPPPKRSMFTVKQVKSLFELATQQYPELLPVLALEWFAGIRPETAELLEYNDIDREQKLIRLKIGKFAQGEAEFVERIPPTVWRWLPRRETGRVAPPNCKHLMTSLHRIAGFNGNWPQDVARHTFVSHFASLGGSLEAVAYAVNHKQASTTLKYYRRRVSLGEAKAYFALKPAITPKSASVEELPTIVPEVDPIPTQISHDVKDNVLPLHDHRE